MEENEKSLISDETRIALGAIFVTGLVILGHDAIVHGYNMNFTSPLLNCSLASNALTQSVAC